MAELTEVEYRSRMLTKDGRVQTIWVDIGDIAVAIELQREYENRVQIQRRTCSPWAEWDRDDE